MSKNCSVNPEKYCDEHHLECNECDKECNLTDTHQQISNKLYDRHQRGLMG